MNPVQTHMHAKEKNGIQISKENCEQRETQKKTMETMKAMAHKRKYE